MDEAVKYIQKDRIFLLNLSGSMDASRLSAISVALRDCMRLNLRNDETIKFLFDFRMVQWDSEATHMKAREISQKHLQEFFGHKYFFAILNNFREGQTFENESFFTQERAAIDWLRRK